MPYISACPIGCGPDLEPTDWLLPEGVLMRCPSCGQLLSQCSERQYWDSMAEFDNPKGTLPDSHSKSRRFKLGKKWLDRLESLLHKPRSQIRLLDVGCSSGAFLSIAKELGFDAEGVEPAPKAAAAAKASGLTVRQGLLQEIGLDADSFDAITLFEVIEHLKEPLALLKECRRILKPGGILLVGTGNVASWTVLSKKESWEYFQIKNHGGHVSFFNPQSMTLAAERSGFSVAAIDTRNVRLVEKGLASPFSYRVSKMAAELLNLPARILGRGHDMQAYLRK